MLRRSDKHQRQKITHDSISYKFVENILHGLVNFCNQTYLFVVKILLKNIIYFLYIFLGENNGKLNCNKNLTFIGQNL